MKQSIFFMISIGLWLGLEGVQAMESDPLQQAKPPISSQFIDNQSVTELSSPRESTLDKIINEIDTPVYRNWFRNNRIELLRQLLTHETHQNVAEELQAFLDLIEKGEESWTKEKAEVIEEPLKYLKEKVLPSCHALSSSFPRPLDQVMGLIGKIFCFPIVCATENCTPVCLSYNEFASTFKYNNRIEFDLRYLTSFSKIQTPWGRRMLKICETLSKKEFQNLDLANQTF